MIHQTLSDPNGQKSCPHGTYILLMANNRVDCEKIALQRKMKHTQEKGGGLRAAAQL